MNHSLITADRGTHIRMFGVALIAALVVVLVGLNATPASAPVRHNLDESWVGPRTQMSIEDARQRRATLDFIEIEHLDEQIDADEVVESSRQVANR